MHLGPLSLSRLRYTQPGQMVGGRSRLACPESQGLGRSRRAVVESRHLGKMTNCFFSTEGWTLVTSRSDERRFWGVPSWHPRAAAASRDSAPPGLGRGLGLGSTRANMKAMKSRIMSVPTSLTTAQDYLSRRIDNNRGASEGVSEPRNYSPSMLVSGGSI